MHSQRNLPPLFLFLSLLLPLGAQTLAAQEVLFESLGTAPYLEQGFSLAVAGDLDGDGREEFWSGAPNPWEVTFEQASVTLLAGSDGALLRTLTSSDATERFGWALASGRDLNGDGVADIVVGAPRSSAGAPYAGRVLAYDGAPGASMSPLWTFASTTGGARFGEALSFMDDLDGDGVAELLVGAPGEPRNGVPDLGAVHILAGATGLPLTVLRGALPGGELGQALAALGDVNSDGENEVAIGMPGAGLRVAGTGLVVVVSLPSGRLVSVHSGDADGDRFGQAISPAGDVDGDGTPDLVIGAPGGKFARVYSGAGGTELWSVSRELFEEDHWSLPELNGSFGAAVTSVGDQDGDGLDDVVVGYPAHSSVWLFSGADASVLGMHTSAHQLHLRSETLSVFFGWSLARIEANGAGPAELAVGAPVDLERSAGQLPSEYDVGSVAVINPRTDPAWILDVDEIAAVGDVDRDGFADVVLVGGGDVQIVSGRNGSPIRTWRGLAVTSVGRAGDVNADGVPDLIVGNHQVQASQGEVRVLSGRTGAELHLVVGLVAGDRFGTSVAGIGDVDGDGHADFAVGAPRALHPAASTCSFEIGYVRVFSGASGAVLHHLDGEGIPGWDCDSASRVEAFGFRVCGVGDWNDDAVPDFAASAPGGGDLFAGEVRVFSGADGSLLREFGGSYFGEGEFGISLGGGQRFDVDADGYPDLLVGEQHIAYGPHQTTGNLQVFSGRNGALLHRIEGTLPPTGYSNVFGPAYAVAAIGDFDRDGHSDFVLGNPVTTGPLGPGQGEVVVYSGLDGSELARIGGTSSWDYLGYSVVSVGDVNHDGADDVLALAWARFTPSSFRRARILLGFGRNGTGTERDPWGAGPR